jgi:uncharacterized protein
MSHENKQLIEKLNAAWTAGDTEGLLRYYAEDVVWTIAGELTLNGLPAVREFMAPTEGHEPPLISVDKMVAEGDSVICYGEMTMGGTPECAGTYSYCDVYTIMNGKVSELRSFVIKHKSEDEKNEAAAA